MNNRIAWKRAGIVLLSCMSAAAGSPAQTFTTLASFNGTNGANPAVMSLVQSIDGNLYGTTSAGGTGYGTVFKIAPGGALTTVHSFDLTDGSNPGAGLLPDSNGNLYGVACDGGGGYGTVFKIAPGGALTTLHTFTGTDGSCPGAPLVQGPGGSFYGTTSGGDGTFFKIAPDGTLTTLANFGSPNGSSPVSLVLATDGDFYGTTEFGGTGSDCSSGCGTFFKVTPGGDLTTLHSFNYTGGALPLGPLTQAADGNFYGTTQAGKTGYGTVFKITPGGALTTLQNFDTSNGSNPTSGVIQGTDGNFYGTTEAGGSAYNGTIFKIASDGKLTTLHDFSLHSPDGSNPESGLVQGTDGNFYGATFNGGSDGDGIVYSLSVGLGAFVKALPHFAAVGDKIKILGTDLAGATSVRFNGVSAVFTVVSPTEISTTVPAGATTGKIRVTTPGGTLWSAGPFQVVP